MADVGLSSPAAARALGEETVRVLCERIRDRELRVRLHAVVAVGRIYQAAVGGPASASSASGAAGGDEEEEEEGGGGGGGGGDAPLGGGLNAWLRRIPYELLGAFKTASKSRDVQTSARVCRTFDDLVLPSAGAGGDAPALAAAAVCKRTRALLSLYRSAARAPRWLDAAAAANAQAGLNALLCSRKVLQEHARRFLSARRRLERAEKAAEDSRAEQKADGGAEEEGVEGGGDAMDVELDEGDDGVRAARVELAAAQKLLVARTSDPGARGQSRADIGKLVHALNKMRDKNVFVLLGQVRQSHRSEPFVFFFSARFYFHFVSLRFVSPVSLRRPAPTRASRFATASCAIPRRRSAQSTPSGRASSATLPSSHRSARSSSSSGSSRWSSRCVWRRSTPTGCASSFARSRPGTATARTGPFFISSVCSIYSFVCSYILLFALSIALILTATTTARTAAPKKRAMRRGVEATTTTARRRGG